MDSLLLVVLAVIAFAGSSMGGVAAAIVTTRATKQAQEDARDAARKAAEVAVAAQLATSQAQIDAGRAQAAAANAAAELVRTARNQATQLDAIERTAVATHIIVNSQKTEMLRVLAALAQRVAKDNPDDKDAQAAAYQATRDALAASNPPDQ